MNDIYHSFMEPKAEYKKLCYFTEGEMQTLRDAVKVGIAKNAMSAVHIAVDLLRGHVEMKRRTMKEQGVEILE
jgi:hypothetical protein